MTHRRRIDIGAIFLLDGALVFGAWLASYALRFHVLGLPVPRGMPSLATYVRLGAFVVPLTWIVLNSLGAYRIGQLRSGLSEAGLVARGVAITTLLVALGSYFTRGEIARSVLIIFGACSTAALCADRLVVRAALRDLRRRGRSISRVLVVGTGAPAAGLVERIRLREDLALVLVGLVAETSDRSGAAIERLSVLGTIADLPSLAERAGADVVFVALAREEHSLEREVLDRLSDSTADVRVVADLGGAFALASRVEDFDGLPIVLVTAVPGDGWDGLAKRIFDLLLAGAALVLLLPVILLLALWVRLDSPGPALYVQERVGFNGRRFRMLKLRTMRADAEEHVGPTWARAGDPRCTRAGRVLRRLALDELPQLWNVLAGDMSLVGPRPERPVFVERFRASIPRYMLRHHVRAGMTGWAQVHGLRGDTPLDRRLEYDLYYIRNWSLGLDLRIVLMTLFSVLRG